MEGVKSLASRSFIGGFVSRGELTGLPFIDVLEHNSNLLAPESGLQKLLQDLATEAKLDKAHTSIDESEANNLIAQLAQINE